MKNWAKIIIISVDVAADIRIEASRSTGCKVCACASGCLGNIWRLRHAYSAKSCNAGRMEEGGVGKDVDTLPHIVNFSLRRIHKHRTAKTMGEARLVVDWERRTLETTAQAGMSKADEIHVAVLITVSRGERAAWSIN
ncbi:hypothetical protein, unlikely [Trypanosoma brucei gambiense DAL972]|uniref:Uncharacterized protein n=1 Tax=Trypanosoma brucei gambiense (strain MHOM/CI/86/DAL972) TaxID=679716 RepID=D0A4P0_TRYB9|nr:hypothetical protein, unlikely [Trypanosoma brucei gambiense DAL972]CBH16234.1 hypothetical protein, unlikely [Trypanosoma brucei gambiense DAL972]|eukprot:XP_011778498.1 hypothetical protein, unlikely [Trypanosoma brucei gambiense DAL972]